MNTTRHIRVTVFGMTQSDFASATGIAQSTLSRWENGAEPDLEGVRKMRSTAHRLKLEWDDSWFLVDSPILPLPSSSVTQEASNA